MQPACRLFVFGLGYVGRWVAQEALEQRWHVSGSCRSAEKAAGFRSTGIDAFTFDLDESYSGLEPAGLEALASATHLLATVPPVADLDRDPLLALHQQQVLAAAHLQWAGYLSTTSVYGDHAGSWVDELAETRGGARAAPRLQAEQEWLGLREQSEGRVASHVFRLAGIYGPGRSALDTVRRARRDSTPAAGTGAGTGAGSGAAAEAPAGAGAGAGGAGEAPRYVSRVHVEDIAAAVLRSAEAPALHAADATYNVADDAPAPRAEVMAYAASLLGLPPSLAAPPEGDGERARRRATESKRVANGRLRKLLQPRGLAHPTYREGLRDIWLDEDLFKN